MGKTYNRPWRYALTMFGLSVMGYMYTTYSTFFYNDKHGLSLVTIGIANILYVIWDAFNDPISGYLSDRTRSRWGRRKPWMLASVPAFAISSVLFFSPPEALGKGVALAVYFTVFLMLTETSNTIASVNYHSLLPELFRDVGERNRANSIRQALQLVGMIIGVSLVPMIAGKLGYSLTALLLAFIGGGLIIYSVLGCKERADFQETPQPKLFQSLLALVKNKNFWLVSVCHFLYQAATGLLLAGIPFFIKYTLGLEDGMTTILTACTFVTAIPSMYLWYRLINRFGALRIWRVALAWLGLSIVPMFFARGLTFSCVAGALIGIGVAGVTANMDMINSELIESDARRYGVRREATIFAGISFVTRFYGLIRTGVFFLIFVLFGFVSAEEPGSAPGTAARFMMAVFPVILMALSTGVSFFVRFESDGGTEPEAEAKE